MTPPYKLFFSPIIFETYDSNDSDAPWQCGGIWGYADSKTNSAVENNSVDNLTIVNDPNANYGPENSQYASHALVGNVVNFMKGDKTTANYEKYVVTVTNNTDGKNTGFYRGNYATEWCGSYFPSEDRAGYCVTKVVVNGTEVTVAPATT